MVVQATNLGDLDHATVARWMNWPVLRTIHLQRLVNAPLMIIAEVLSQDSLEVALVHHDHMIEALSTNASATSMYRKLGFRIDGTLRDEIRRGDRFEDVVCLSILADEWADAESGAEADLAARGLL